MHTLNQLSEQISVQHPNLAASVDKVYGTISNLYYGIEGDRYPERKVLSLREMLKGGIKRVDHIEFYLAFFPEDLRAAFLIKLAMKFKGLDEQWLQTHRSLAATGDSPVEDRQQIDFLYGLFISWIDDNLPLVMNGSYVSRGGWF